MENALFYTFSTIAQTLAAAIALLGAFVLYRLQSLSAEIEDAAGSAIQYYLPNDEVHQLIVKKDYVALVTLLDTIQPPANEAPETVKRHIAALRSLVPLKIQLRFLLKVSLSLTILLIVASVVVLATTPLIAASSSIACTVFGVGVAAFIACLILYALLISKAINEG